MKKIYFENGTRDYFMEFAENNKYSFIIAISFVILICGLLGC